MIVSLPLMRVNVQLPHANNRAYLDLGKQRSVHARQDTARRDGDTTHQLVQLLVIADGELDVSGDDSGLLVVLHGEGLEPTYSWCKPSSFQAHLHACCNS